LRHATLLDTVATTKAAAYRGITVLTATHTTALTTAKINRNVQVKTTTTGNTAVSVALVKFSVV
jgi:hypothetical protein